MINLVLIYRRYLNYLEVDFEAFRPGGAKHCTDGVKSTLLQAYAKISLATRIYNAHIST